MTTVSGVEAGASERNDPDARGLTHVAGFVRGFATRRVENIAF
jgi:hypothetical protein